MARAILVATALLPFLASLAAHAIGARQQAVPTSIRSGLAFDQYLVNLGDVEPLREHVARFAFTNRTDRTVRIVALEPSCGCLNPRLDKKVYQPNESGDFLLRVETANEQPGQKEYHCRMVYEDPEPREVDLEFKVILPEATVMVRPRSLILYALGDGSVSREIVITDTRDRHLELIGVQSSLDSVSATIDGSSRDDVRRREHRVLVEARNIPIGRHQGMITILTNDRDFPQLRVPIWVERPDHLTLDRTASQDNRASEPRSR